MSKTVHQKVEAILREQYPLQNLATDTDLLKIIHHVRTRQLELEIENDELRQALTKPEAAQMSDTAEHKRLEQILCENEACLEERALLARRVEDLTAELRIANAKFLASMSHELRTPLGSILGMSEMLQREISGSLNNEQRDFLKVIVEAGRHLLSLINNILDLSKIGAGLLELNFETVPIPGLCQLSLRFVQQQALEKQIKLISNIDPQVNTLEADQHRLKQILVNLLSNAVKFTPSGGQVGLEVVGIRSESAVHFTVWNTGMGISEVDIQRLFQPFVQLDSSLARKHEGTGLGLALVYRLAELHGGSVMVESQVGQGSRFTVSLPWRSTAVLDLTYSP